MVDNIQYTSIKRVLDNLLDHPLLRDLSLDQAVRYTVRFISLHGYPGFYEDRIDMVEIKDFRGVLPCDLIRIEQVKDCETGICLRHMTDTFTHALEKTDKLPKPKRDLNNNLTDLRREYIPPVRQHREELSFKTQGRVIFTSFPCGTVEVAYKAVMTDDDGFPMIIDDESFIAALEAYIKVQVFTVKFETGKLNLNVLQNAQQDYAFRAAHLNEKMKTPSVSEMQTLSNILTSLHPSMLEFNKGFRHSGDREYIRRH